MPIVFRQWIMPFYAFGTSRRIGFGGQAKEMRGEPNAISVATKWEPSNRPNASGPVRPDPRSRGSWSGARRSWCR